MAKNLETYKLGVVIDANAANALRSFAATDKAASGLAKRFKELEKAGASITRIGAGLSLSITAPLALLGKRAIETAKDFDSLTRGMTAVMKSSEAATAEISKLKEVAKLPGLGFKEAIQGSINLQAAGLSADLARRSLGAFGNALATVGKGKAELDGVGLALSQISSKGKVSAEEINQLAERVPQIRKVMEAAFGTADTEKLQKQKITATDFITKIVAELEKMPKVSGGIQNSFENLSDTIEQALIPLGNVLLKAIVPAINVITPAIESLSQKFSSLSPTTQAVTVGLGVFAAALGPIVVGLGAVTAAIGTLGVPAVAAITALGAAATALGAAWATNFGGIRELTQQAFAEMSKATREQGAVIVGWWKENLPLIKQTVQTVLNAVKAFWSKHGAEVVAVIKTSWQILSATIGTAIKTVLGVIKLGMQVINGDWSGAWKTLIQTAQAAVGGVAKVIGLFAQRAHELFKLAIGGLLDLNAWIRNKMIELGVSIVQGVIQGIKNTASKLWTATKEMALNAYQSAKDALISRSPSRLFMKLGSDVVEGFLIGIRLRESEVKKVLSDLLKEAVTTAKAIAGLSDLRVFQARNRNQDIQEQLDRAEELFKLRRELGTIEGAPNIPISGAIPGSDGLVRQQIEFINSLKGLSEAVSRTRSGEIGLLLGDISEEALQVPNLIREITEALDEQTRQGVRAADVYEDIKKGLQGIIDAAEGLTPAQRLQRRILELPEDAPPQQRAELEGLFNRARSAEIQQEKEREPKQKKKPSLFERMGINISGLRNEEGEMLPDMTRMQGAVAGMKSAFEEVKALGAEVFSQWSQGVGSMIENWVLMGETGPAALKKITAQVLASAAAESAILAIVETAKGFATLFTNPAESAGHFTAAAIFAGVAGGAAIAGRALAGNSFNGKQKSNPSEAGLNRDVTSEGYAGNRFYSGQALPREAYMSDRQHQRTQDLLAAINDKLTPTSADNMVLASLKKNVREVGRTMVDAVNGDALLGARLRERTV